LANLFRDGEEFVGVAANGGCEIFTRGGDADAVERRVVAGHVFLGEPGDALPVDGVAFTGEGGAADQTEIYAKAVMLGEVLENL
jgi:hypothetical protein